MHRQVRNLIDLTDAISKAAMKRAIEIDAIADIELEAAKEFLEEVQVAAPGSAPILEAGAAWLVRANAYTQALFAVMRSRLDKFSLPETLGSSSLGSNYISNFRTMSY